jgi:hypothetical protein
VTASQPSFYRILSSQDEKKRKEYANDLKVSKTKSIIASPSILGKDIQANNLQYPACQKQSPFILM